MIGWLVLFNLDAVLSCAIADVLVEGHYVLLALLELSAAARHHHAAAAHAVRCALQRGGCGKLLVHSSIHHVCL
jgi:hypothetical protein